jgi:hypothetical protein
MIFRTLISYIDMILIKIWGCRMTRHISAQKGEVRLVTHYWDQLDKSPEEVYYVNEEGMKHGLYKMFYPGGKIHSQCEYVNGNRHGVYQAWYQDGRIWERFTLVNGNRHGLCEHWRYGYGEKVINEHTWFTNGLNEVSYCSYYDGDKLRYVNIKLTRNISIEGGVFLGSVISELVEKGVKYDIQYID